MRKIIITFFLLIILSIKTYTQVGSWVSIGGSGNTLTRLHFNVNGDTLFVGTIEGYRFYSLISSMWEIREMTGYVGRTVWCITSVPVIFGRVITGRVNAFFKGYIELNDNFVTQGVIVRNSQGGKFTDIKYLPDNPLILYACAWSDVNPGDLVKTTNGGLNWNLLTGYLHTAMTEIAVNPINTNIVYVSGDAKITKTTNGGLSWSYSYNGLPSNLGCYCIAVNPFNPNVMLTSNDSGIYRSTDAGGNWIKVYSGVVCRRFEFHPLYSGLVAGITFSPYKLLISTNSGTLWGDSTGAFPGNNMVDLVFSKYDNNLYVASSTTGVYKRLFIVTGIKDNKNVIGDRYILFQNYPNPFNAITKIRFEIPRDLFVKLRVYSIDGREVACILNECKKAGSYVITFNGEELPSGIYFYKLESESFADVRKMIILK
ncbi:MAG: T9SS type A sorting domain-containing protein [Ignavibacteria bacterium]|nr:T9SS type A sorting domain-containing protein [Ignavibacteria bacterium]